jgi:hypothetical protein
MPGIGSHQSSSLSVSDEWLTPYQIIRSSRGHPKKGIGAASLFTVPTFGHLRRPDFILAVEMRVPTRGDTRLGPGVASSDGLECFDVRSGRERRRRQAADPVHSHLIVRGALAHGKAPGRCDGRAALTRWPAPKYPGLTDCGEDRGREAAGRV